MSTQAQSRTGVEPATGRVDRLDLLTAARFPAALAVFVYHAIWFFGMASGTSVNDTLTRWIMPLGGLGVSFFFVLSGFVLTWSASPDRSATDFVRARLAKIWPNHALTWLGMLVVMALVGTTVPAGVALLNLGLLHAWVPQREVFFSVNVASWSLACELFFYLCFPLLHRWLRGLSVPAVRALALIMVVGTLAVALVATQLPTDPARPGFPSPLAVWLVYLFPVTRLLEFVLGMCLARLLLLGRPVRLPIVPLTVLLVVAYSGAVWAPQLLSLVTVMVVPLALMVSTLAATESRAPQRIPVPRWAIVLGETSFAFYLVHSIVLDAGNRMIGGGLQLPFGEAYPRPASEAVMAVTVLLLVSLSLAWLVHRVWEVPLHRRLRGARPTRVGEAAADPAR